MSKNRDDFSTEYDRYSDYEDAFDPLRRDRQARRKRKPKQQHQPKRNRQQVLQDIADVDALEAGFAITYQPALFEQGWLKEALRPFFEQALITDVLAKVKGGKEANVYRCAAHPSTGVQWLAAKVYRPRMFRNLRNDKQYRQGRELLSTSGRPLKARDKRMQRAIAKGSSFGESLEHTSWLMHEYRAMQALYNAGADVPRPYGVGEMAVIMGYVGDEQQPAPTLHEIHLPPDEARQIWRRIVHNIDCLLQQGYAHGDLSAYNILYHEGAITLIDFPQVVDIHHNPDARAIFARDVYRVCQYLAEVGLFQNAERIAHRVTAMLWERYVRGDFEDKLADVSLFEVEETDL
ncbi:MAG: hypothetical protein D6712_09020 [Chloroflexi bacterium]|nr:MAG: hypothetical protein D6712_09020 [Chloroflexota bacterium]